MSLCIFSFQKSDVRPNPAVPPGVITRESAAGTAALDEPRDAQSPQSTVLDLGDLTPEVLEKFFPSESTLAASAAKRR